MPADGLMSTRYRYGDAESKRLASVFDSLIELSPETLSKAAELPQNQRIMMDNNNILSTKVKSQSGDTIYAIAHKVARYCSSDDMCLELLRKPDHVLLQRMSSRNQDLNGSTVPDIIAANASERVVMIMLNQRVFEEQIPVIAKRDILDAQLAIAKMPFNILNSRDRLGFKTAGYVFTSSHHEVREELSANQDALKVKIEGIGVVPAKVTTGSDPDGKYVNIKADPVFYTNYYIAHLLLSNPDTCKKIMFNIAKAGPKVDMLVAGNGKTVAEMMIDSVGKVKSDNC
jgi:hypothetical protein